MGYSADYWLIRAEETRMIARQMMDDETRQIMLRIAARYEKLAKKARTESAATDDLGGPHSSQHKVAPEPQLDPGKL